MRKLSVATLVAFCLAVVLHAAVTMTITPSNPSILTGATVQLLASPVFVKQRWSSSNTAVATVSASGLVTGVAAGSSTITVAYKNNRGTTSVTVYGADPLTVLCPANKNVDSSDGNPVTTTYTATSSGGTAPRVITFSPASGSSFAVGVTTVTATVTDATSATDTCQFNVIVTDTSPAADYVTIATNESIQTKTTDNPAGTTFLLATGTHTISSAITPKTGNTYLGEDGAIISGSGWSSADTTQGAFRAWNQDIDNVTIKNLKITTMPQNGIAVSGTVASGWVVDDVEITACTREGINMAGVNMMIKNSNIHHNTFGGYSVYKASDMTLQNNTIAYNGAEQKVTGSQRVYFLANWVHHNTGDGIWYDTDNLGSIIDGNTVEDQGRMGIHVEITGQGIIRNNIVKRSADTGIFIVTSKDQDVYNNTLVDNFRGIRYYLKCTILGGGTMLGGWDLANNNVHDNFITLPTTSGAWANGMNSPSGSCTAAQALPYYDGTKNLKFVNNKYDVPTTTSRYWIWDTAFKSFTEWQSLLNDATGTVQ